jgi:hypothetical protein
MSRMREQLFQAEVWIADKNDECRRLRIERDAASLELAILRKAQAELQAREDS